MKPLVRPRLRAVRSITDSIIYPRACPCLTEDGESAEVTNGSDSSNFVVGESGCNQLGECIRAGVVSLFSSHTKFRALLKRITNSKLLPPGKTEIFFALHQQNIRIEPPRILLLESLLSHCQPRLCSDSDNVESFKACRQSTVSCHPFQFTYDAGDLGIRINWLRSLQLRFPILPSARPRFPA